jgi:hypothetical protein
MNEQVWWDFLAPIGILPDYRVVSVDCANTDAGASDPVTPSTPLVGLNETLKDITGFVTYPNPSKGVVNYRLAAMKDANATILVMDNLGRTVIESKQSLTVGSNLGNLDLSTLSKGLYQITIQTGTAKVTNKIVVE